MPQYRVLRSFGIPGRGLLGHVRTGDVITLSEQQAASLNRPHGRRSPIIEPYAGPALPERILEPEQNAAIADAPKRKRGRPPKAKAPPVTLGELGTPAQDLPAASPDAGAARRSSSAPRVRASRAKTSSDSEGASGSS